MKYKLMEITDIYSEYADQVSERDAGWSYEQHHQEIFDDCYCEADYIHRIFRDELGLETMHVYYDYRKLQEKWDQNPDKEPFSILLRQIKAFDPNVILVMTPSIITKEKMEIIRHELHHTVHFISYYFSWITEDIKQVLPEYELICTGSYFAANQIKQYNNNVHVVRHAFEPSILPKLSHTDSKNKIGFIGSIIIIRSGHTNRIDLLASLKKNQVDFDYYGKVHGSFLNPKRLIEHIVYEPWRLPERVRTEKYLKETCKPSQFGLAYYETLARYSINVNLHADIAGTGAGNMRMFEVTGVGSCLLTDYREENEMLFEENKEIVVFRNYDDLADKAKFLLKHPEEAKRIAQNGQKRTLRDYTYRNKALAMDKLIQDIL